MSSDLGRRVGTALLVLPLLAAALLLGPAWLTEAIVIAALLVGMRELLALFGAAGAGPMGVPAYALAGLVFASVAHPVPAPVLPAVALVALAAALWRCRGDVAGAVPAVGATLFAAVYLGGLGGALAALRTAAPDSAGGWRVVLLLAGVMGSDTLAYFTGTAVGRTRLAPRLSPSKTVEGALGSLAGGAIAVAAVGVPALGVPGGHAALLGLGVGAASIVGDLGESLIKRWAGVKDSGRLFPGHGGMLDRLDSVLAGAPVVYYYFLTV